MPVIVLTARDSVTDTVTALEGGADDYMPKPFRFAELLARVRLRLRAAGAGRRPVPREDDARRPAASSSTCAPAGSPVAGSEFDLSAREFALAEIFLLNPGQVLSREQLLDHVWGYDFDPGSNVVDVYVGYLRRKLGADTRSRPCAGWATASTALEACRSSRGRRGCAAASTGSSASATSCGSGRSSGSRSQARRDTTFATSAGTPSGSVAGASTSCGKRSATSSASGSPSSKAR